MEVKVKLFATLREGRFKEQSFELQHDSRVTNAIEKCAISPEEIAICMVNGRHADGGQILKNGDTLSLFPPVGGG